jgi:hypothetical protein
MLTIVTQTDPEQIDRPDEPWKYPYVAGIIDFGSNIKVRVTTQNQSRVGYVISPQLFISSTDPAVMGFLEEFCENHQLKPLFDTKDEGRTITMKVTKRDDVRRLLLIVAPYVIVRREVVAILTEDLIPGMEAGKQSDEEGFVELMGYVDEIREHTIQRSEPKYTQDYFRDEFDL